MTPILLSQAFTVAGSLLALWLYVRLGSRRPASFGRALLHVGIAAAVITAVHATLDVADAGSSLRGTTALFALFLPALTYAFLSALYLLEHLHRSFGLR